MSFVEYILVYTLWLLLMVFITRGIIFYVISYQLSRKAYVKRKRKQSFLQWLTYALFKEQIPKFLIFWYFGHFAFYIVEILLLSILTFFKMPYDAAKILLGINFYVYGGAPCLILGFILFDFKDRGKVHVERLIKKKKK